MLLVFFQFMHMRRIWVNFTIRLLQCELQVQTPKHPINRAISHSNCNTHTHTPRWHTLTSAHAQKPRKKFQWILSYAHTKQPNFSHWPIRPITFHSLNETSISLEFSFVYRPNSRSAQKKWSSNNGKKQHCTWQWAFMSPAYALRTTRKKNCNLYAIKSSLRPIWTQKYHTYFTSEPVNLTESYSAQNGCCDCVSLENRFVCMFFFLYFALVRSLKELCLFYVRVFDKFSHSCYWDTSVRVWVCVFIILLVPLTQSRQSLHYYYYCYH